MSELEPESTGENLELALDKNEADETHAREALDKAIAAGYMTEEDVETFFGEDTQDILIGVASYIEMSGDDAETVMKGWGLAEERSDGEV